MTIRPTHPDGTPLTIREQLERAGLKKAKREAKALFLWPRQALDGPPRPRKQKTERQRIRARLDHLWSLVVRKRDAKKTGGLCRICGVRPGTCAYHIIPKQRGDMLRWDLRNGCLACGPCNYAEMINRSLYQDDHHPRIFGAALIDELKTLAKVMVHFSMPDLKQKEIELKKELGAL